LQKLKAETKGIKQLISPNPCTTAFVVQNMHCISEDKFVSDLVMLYEFQSQNSKNSSKLANPFQNTFEVIEVLSRDLE